MTWMQEFKEFAMKGNVIDMAVGVIIGAAFGKIPGTLVDKVIMPVLGILVGGLDFKDQGFVLRAAHGDSPAVVLGYGALLQSVIEFTIIAAVIFTLVRTINKLKTPAEAPAPVPVETPRNEVLLAEIRDLLQSKSVQSNAK